MMLLVLDTNVLVSALLKPGSVPDRALSVIWARDATILYDARIADEYRSVLARPKFRAIERARIDDVLAELIARGKALEEVARWDGAMTDDDDRIFVEVALAGHARDRHGQRAPLSDRPRRRGLASREAPRAPGR